jgi:hypothetical protein
MKKTLILTLFTFLFISSNAQNNSILIDTMRLKNFINKKTAWGDSVLLGYSKTNEFPIYAYKFNNNSSKKALIMAGVHGSEFYGVDVVSNFIAKLKKTKPTSFKWDLIVIPELLVENVVRGRQSIFEMEKKTDSLIAIINRWRCTCKGCPDPNRQMPSINNLFELGKVNAHNGATLEIENQYLLQLVQYFNPERIASIHCKNEFSNEQIGIYADPRTDRNQIALGFRNDSILAIRMALKVRNSGGIIFGNFRNSRFTSIYPLDPKPERAGKRQYRSYEKSDTTGVSFGTWASTKIYKNDRLVKDAAKMITVELPQYYSFFKGETKVLDIDKLYTNTNAYVKALLEDFLSNN